MSISVLFSEFMALMNPTSIFNAFWATGFGIIVGMLPGLTATMGVALLTGLTFRFMPEQAMVVLISTYVGSIYGGSRSAILLNIPGTPANAATCLDGNPLARKGEAGYAIGLAEDRPEVRFVGVLRPLHLRYRHLRQPHRPEGPPEGMDRRYRGAAPLPGRAGPYTGTPALHLRGASAHGRALPHPRPGGGLRRGRDHRGHAAPP